MLVSVKQGDLYAEFLPPVDDRAFFLASPCHYMLPFVFYLVFAWKKQPSRKERLLSAYWFGAFSVSGIFVSPIFVLLASCSVILAMISLLPTGLGFLFVSVAIFCVDIMQTLAKIIVEIMPMYISMKINNGLLCCLIVILVFSAFIFTQKLNVLLRFCSVVVMVFLVMFLIWISQ